MDIQFFGGRGGKSGKKTKGKTMPATQPSLNPFSDTDSGAFRYMADDEEHAYYERQILSESEKAAFALYTNPNREPGSLYNFSQNMNYAHVHGLPMTQQQKDTFNTITNSMHNLGYNAELTRYDHSGLVTRLMGQAGISGTADSTTLTKLQKMIGMQYTDDRILSTSANNFKNSTDPSTFTTRLFKFTYQAKASTQAVMPGDSKIPSLRKTGMMSGDTFSEILLSPKNRYIIKDIRYSGAKARRKGMPKTSLTKKQIEIVIEVEGGE